MLSDDERADVIERLRAGTPLPLRYRSALFGGAAGPELVWAGKPDGPPPRVRRPLQTVERVPGRRSGWADLLVRGDNRVVLAALLGPPWRARIEAAGGIRLAYLDPPFDVGGEVHVDVAIGDAAVVQDLAYRDVWGSGPDSYAAMLHERLVLLHELLHPDGFVFVHCDWRVNSTVRLLLDEVFGGRCFRNEIIWRRAPNLGRQAASAQLGRVVDTIYAYSKRPGTPFPGAPPMRSEEVPTTRTGVPANARWDAERARYFTTAPRGDYTDESIAALDAAGRVHRSASGRVSIKYFLRADSAGRWWKDQRVDTLWDDDAVRPLRHRPRRERWGYRTQKPEGLLERIVGWASAEGDLVADVFCGSGTTLAVAERMGRRWIGVDAGRHAVHTSRKRLLSVRSELGAAGRPVGPFAVLETAPPPDHRARVWAAYGARRSAPPPFHAATAEAAVFVGPPGGELTAAELEAIVAAARRTGTARVDVLAARYADDVVDVVDVRPGGVLLVLRTVPADVGSAGTRVRFPVAHRARVEVRRSGDVVTVSLAGFEALSPDPADGHPGIVVEGDALVRHRRTGPCEVLSLDWRDRVDAWAIDVDAGRQRPFTPSWSAARTPGDRSLAFSAPSYRRRGPHVVEVRVTDVFAHETRRRVTVAG